MLLYLLSFFEQCATIYSCLKEEVRSEELFNAATKSVQNRTKSASDNSLKTELTYMYF